MRRSWIPLLGFLAIVTTNCLGFTVERSRAGSFPTRNWSSPIFHIDRRASIEKIFDGEIHSGDIENILRDSEMRQMVKLPDKKCSSTSEDPQRVKRSDDILNITDHSTNVEKIASEAVEPAIVSSSSEIKTSGSTSSSKVTKTSSSHSTIVSSPRETKNSASSTIVGSPSATKTSESTIVETPKETKTSESVIVASTKVTKKTSEPTILSRPRETKISEIISKKSAENESPRNVVLLLIEDVATGLKNKRFEAAHKFPVRGYLQNCHNAERPVSTKFSLGDSLVSGKNKDEDCECDSFLRANIGSLLSWARHIREMTTGAVSATNFTIPLSLVYETPTSQLVKEFEYNDEINGMRQEAPRAKPESREIWRSIDAEKQTNDNKQSTRSAASASPSLGSSSRQDGINGYEGTWDVFDMFSRIRIAFFRILLESLGNMARTEDELNGKRPIAVQPSLVELISDAIAELKSVPNDKGFILVAAAPGNELSAAVEVLQREISTKETLLVISGICSPINEPVPYFVRGPGEKSLHEARAIWDLPGLIRGAMGEGCLDKSCTNQRIEEPLALPSLELSSLPHEPPRKRFGRVATKEESSDSATDEKSTTETDDETEDDNVSSTTEIGLRSGSPDIRVDGVAKIFGIVTSIATMLALSSS